MAWQQLVDIARQAAAERDAELSQPPQACPNDGEPLRPGPRGELYCRFDGWQWPRDDTRPAR
ncbi:MAG: hypothetical protein ACRDT2_11065 [Natronosporangium sp.]